LLQPTCTEPSTATGPSLPYTAHHSLPCLSASRLLPRHGRTSTDISQITLVSFIHSFPFVPLAFDTLSLSSRGRRIRSTWSQCGGSKSDTIRRGGSIAALKRHVSKHVHEIIPNEAISDCPGVSKFKALAVRALGHYFCHWSNLIVSAKELESAGFVVSRGRGLA
jgi:hypothetical protein